MRPWVVCHTPNPKADLRLICFPYAGSGGTVFRGWQECMPTSIEVCPIELPGRWSRMEEPAITSMPVLIRALAEGLENVLDRPFAFFGYSMGALVAFELTRYLRKHSGLAPQHLVIAARNGPSTPRPEATRVYALPHDQFLERVTDRFGPLDPTITADEGVLRLVLGILRADLQLLHHYTYTEEVPLAVPITAFGGDRDRLVSPEGLENWRQETVSGFTLHMFTDGDHFFIRTVRDELISRIVQALGL